MFDEELDQLGGGRRNTFSEWFVTATLLCCACNIAFEWFVTATLLCHVCNIFFAISLHFISVLILYCIVLFYHCLHSFLIFSLQATGSTNLNLNLNSVRRLFSIGIA